MKKVVSLILMLCLVLIPLATFTSCTKTTESGTKYKTSSDPTNYVLMTVKDYGQIIIELDPETAPITVANFKKLVSQKFYDGLTFHRISKGFMIQGGDPKGNGTGDAGETIKGEFSANGVENNLSHTRGVISMARGEDMDSASCQFFICHADSTFLDGNYAAFGRVIDGMDTVDAIANCKVTLAYLGAREVTWPVTKIYIQSVKFIELVNKD